MTDLIDKPEILDVPAIAEVMSKKSDRKTSKPDGDDLTEFQYANALAGTLPPLKTSGKDWHAYSHGTWEITDRNIFRPAAQNILPEFMRTERRAAALLDHLEGRSQVAAESFIGFNKLGIDGSVLINVGNGVLAVTPSEVKVLTQAPDYNFTTRTAANYDVAATAPIFNRILTEALPDEGDRRLYQLCAGNILLPDCRYEVSQINYGEAGRCKSTPAEAVAGALGSNLVTRLSMGHICDPKSYHLPKLRHAAVNLGTELDAIEMGDSATFKALVSGEPVEARPIYGSPFTMQTTCKLWFLANGLPRFKHGTEAELRRIRFLRFDYLPPTKDTTLKARLAAERDGIFLWMLQGLRDLLTLPEMPLGGKNSQAVHDRFRISNDPVGTFVKLHCRLDPTAFVEKTALRREYGDFCDRYEIGCAFGDWFFRALYERWPNLLEVRPGTGARRARGIAGLALLP